MTNRPENRPVFSSFPNALSEGDAPGGAKVGEFVRGEAAVAGGGEPFAEGGGGLEKGGGVGLAVLVEGGGPGLVEDAELQRPGVEIDAGVESVLSVVGAFGLRPRRLVGGDVR